MSERKMVLLFGFTMLYFSGMEEVLKDDDYIKGRGAQIKTANKFLKQQYVVDHMQVLILRVKLLLRKMLQLC